MFLNILFSLDHITCFHKIWAITFVYKKDIFNIRLFLIKNVRNKRIIMHFKVRISVIAPRLQLFFWYMLNPSHYVGIVANFQKKLRLPFWNPKNFCYVDAMHTNHHKIYHRKAGDSLPSPSHDESCEYESFMILFVLPICINCIFSWFVQSNFTMKSLLWTHLKPILYFLCFFFFWVVVKEHALSLNFITK